MGTVCQCPVRLYAQTGYLVCARPLSARGCEGHGPGTADHCPQWLYVQIGYLVCARPLSASRLQAAGDATDCGHQGTEQPAIFPAAGAPARQQIHLHKVHRINIRIAQ